MDTRWYKNAIIYSLDIETFNDSDADGIGDIRGLISRLEYIAGLGVECIWLLPFFPSPNRDNGYDVMDYYAVDERLGTMKDFLAFMEQAAKLHIRVIIDLVVNHTSIAHPWFQEARKDRESRYRDYYVWSDEPQHHKEEHLIFPEEENTIWTYDEEAGQYYLHHFYREQPDLNIANPAVRGEILKIMDFWLGQGVSGFRIDAAELLIEPYGLPEVEDKDLSNFLDEMRDFVEKKKPGAILLAEANVLPDKTRIYLDKGARMHMVFNFFLNQHLFLALARENASPLYAALEALPEIADSHQWLNFLRHHDELNLDLLSDDEQKDILNRFAPEKNMRIFGTGIRRRLVPMLDGDKHIIRMAHSLLFSLPGVPMLRYGDEIGMGENLALEGRNSVRTPMQWTDEPNGGFSATGKKLTHPVIAEGPYAFDKVNVRAARKDAGSLLHLVESLAGLRNRFPEIGDSRVSLIRSEHPSVFVHCFPCKERKLVFCHNLSGEELALSFETLQTDSASLQVLLGEENILKAEEGLRLRPYGFAWMIL